jgi:CRISPR-associated endoribonuclease Cas6
MRLHLKIKSSNQTIPFDHQPLLVGCIHKWLGWNDVHGNVALFSFSRLDGCKATNDGFLFRNGSTFFISTFDTDMVKQLIKGIQNDPVMFHGLTVDEIIIEQDPDLTERDLFFTASPILISRRINDKIEQIFYDDPRASQFLKETIKTKMDKAGISDDGFDIRFDTTYHKAGTKMVTYKGIKNRASWCPVVITGNPKIKRFIWNVGLGNSTGIGFGAIK